MIFSVVDIVLVFYSWFIKIKNRRNFYIITILIFTLLGLLVSPTEGMDVQSHWEMLDIMRTVGYERTKEIYSYSLSNMPVYSFYFYLISKLSFNQILLSITYFIVYGTQLMILWMAKKDFTLTKNEEKLAYMGIICLTNAYELTGIRNLTAFAICALFLYLELIRGRFRITSWFVYCGLCFFHDSVVAVVVFRLVSFFVSEKNLNIVMLVVFLWPPLINYIAPILTSAFNSIIINNVLDKVFFYSSAEADVFVSGFSFSLVFFLRMVIILIALVSIYFWAGNGIYKKWKVISILILSFCLGGVFVPAIVVRFIPLAFYMIIPFYRVFTLSVDSQILLKNDKAIRKICFSALLLFFVAHLLSLIIFQYPYFSLGI